MTVGELHELDEVKILVAKGLEAGILTFGQVATALAEVETAREPFRRHLEGLQDEFARSLAAKYAKRTVNSAKAMSGQPPVG